MTPDMPAMVQAAIPVPVTMTAPEAKGYRHAVRDATDRAGKSLPVSQVIGGRPAGCPHRFCGCVPSWGISE